MFYNTTIYFYQGLDINKNTGSKKIFLSSAKMAVATFLSRILGLVRELLMAHFFGASGLTDAFTIAYRIPNMLRDLFAEGAFSSAFVPIFTEVLQIGEKEARRLFWSLFILLGSITITISIGIIVFAPEILQLFTNELFTKNKERYDITILLIRIMAPFLCMVSLAALFMGALNSLKIFFMPSLAPAFFNIVMILSILFLPPILEKNGLHSIISMGIGVLFGGFIQLAVQVPILFKRGFSPLGPIKLRSSYTKRILSRVGIGTIGIAAQQINILVTTILATGTVVGAVSWLTYGFRLFQFPVGILSVSIAGSNLVHFSEAWKKDLKDEAISYLKSSYIMSFYTIIPALALLVALAKQSVVLIFEHGKFTEHDTLMTTEALYFYLVGLPFYGLYKIFAPTFFTLDKPKIPVMISSFCIIFNIIFCVLLTPKYGFKILALGTSLSMLLNCTIQGIALKNILGLNFSFFMNFKILKVCVSGVLVFILTRWVAGELFDYDASFASQIASFSAACFAGIISYLLLLLLFGETHLIKKLFRKKVL